MGTKVFNFSKGSLPSLLEEERTLIEEEAIEVASAGFVREKTSAFILDVKQHIRSGELYCCFGSGGRMVAFRMIDRPTLEIVYLAGAVKKPEAPKYLIRELTKKILNELKPKYTVTRTQNSHVVDMLIDLCKEVIPLDRLPTDEEIKSVEICGIKGYSDQKLIIPKYYGSPMIGKPEKPKSVNPKVESFMEEIDYFAGDARVLIGRELK